MTKITDLPNEMLLAIFMEIHEHGSVFDMQNAAEADEHLRDVITSNIFATLGWEHGYSFKDGNFRCHTIGISGVELDATRPIHRRIMEKREEWQRQANETRSRNNKI